MAVVRDYLITQFTIFGAEVLVGQFEKIIRQINEIIVRAGALRLGIDPERFAGALKLAKGDISGVAEEADSLTSALKGIMNIAQRTRREFEEYSRVIANLGERAEGSVKLFRERLTNLEYETSKAILAITRGKYDEAAKRISKITDQFSALQSSFNAIYGYANVKNLQNLSIVIRRALADRLAELSTKFSQLADVGFVKINKEVKNAINNTNKLIMITGALGIAMKSFGIFAIASLVSVARVLYTVGENIRTAYRLMIDLGTSLPAAFSISRTLRQFGFDVDVITTAVSKLSDTITKNQLGARLMLGWLNLSPFMLQGKSSLEAIDMILDRLMKLPSVSLRRSIGKELLGERFPELLMLKDMGILNEIMEMQSYYSGEFLKNTMKLSFEWAKLKMAIQDVGIIFAKALLPAIQSIVVAVRYIVANSKLLFTIVTVLGILLIGLKKPVAGVPLTLLGLIGLYQSFKDKTNENLISIRDELRIQTNILDLQYRTLNTIKMQLNQFLATTARGVPNLYQASIYRALLTNTGGI
jgi:hypothetical protein